MRDEEKWDRRYLRLAFEAASWSKDPSTKVGAVWVSPSNNVLGTGFNGFAPGADDSPSLYHDRTYKYANVVHAEVNALWAAPHHQKPGTFPVPIEGGTLYTSFPCCPDCADVAIYRKVARVVFPPLPIEGRSREWVTEWAGRQQESIARLMAAGVRVSKRHHGET